MFTLSAHHSSQSQYTVQTVHTRFFVFFTWHRKRSWWSQSQTQTNGAKACKGSSLYNNCCKSRVLRKSKVEHNNKEYVFFMTQAISWFQIKLLLTKSLSLSEIYCFPWALLISLRCFTLSLQVAIILQQLAPIIQNLLAKWISDTGVVEVRQ